jgi:putative tricarboxylic transport membrane protein
MIFEMTHDTICHSIRLITHSKARGMIRIPGRYCIAAGLAAALAVGATPSALAQWKPDRMTELIVSVAPGGNQDITARTIQSIWQERKILSPVNVINKPGGGGAIAYTHMSQRTKDPSQLLILAPTMMTSRIMGVGQFTHRDFTPIAMLFNEYIFTVVKAESPLKSGVDLIRRFKESPDSLSVGVATAVGNHIHMGIALPMKAAGVDIKKMKVVAFKSSGQSLTAVLGGHIEVAAATFAAVLPHVTAGSLRIVGVSAPQRMGGALATIPTWKEQGANAVFDSWRGIVGTKGISEAQVKYWEAAFLALSQTEEWKADIDKNYRVNHFLNGRDSNAYWDAQYKELEEGLTELGLAKR